MINWNKFLAYSSLLKLEKLFSQEQLSFLTWRWHTSHSLSTFYSHSRHYLSHVSLKKESILNGWNEFLICTF